MKTKVLFIVMGFTIGGIETYLDRFLRFSQGKIDSTVLSKSGKGGFYEKSYVDSGSKIVFLRFGYFNLFDWYKFFRFLKKSKFDAICDFTGLFSAIPLFIAKLAGVPKRIVFYRGSVHQWPPTFFRKLYARLIDKILSFSATKILANSKTALDNFYPSRDRTDPKFKVIYNGISLSQDSEIDEDSFRKSLNIPKDGFIVGHVGRYAKPKNHNTICETAHLVLQKNKNIYFLLVGREVEKNIGSFIDEKGIRENFILPGECKPIYPYLRIMDAFLFPSINEGQPNALLEAMIMGLPIVASDISSIVESVPEVVTKNNLFPPKDANAMAQKIEEIFKGNRGYDVDEQIIWMRKSYNPNERFQDFLNELS